MDRLDFLVKREGLEAARKWALDAARTYRRVVLDMRGPKPKYTMYRTAYAREYLKLKRFALSGSRSRQDGGR